MKKKINLEDYFSVLQLVLNLVEEKILLLTHPLNMQLNLYQDISGSCQNIMFYTMFYVLVSQKPKFTKKLVKKYENKNFKNSSKKNC